ncbi:hypothetical protein B484DRAFT_438722 [Ochromonadaceae sp. CCMP2298]|nr:hypothetical protein B484DRAFT_438722 [Ochromonadaceae sp. CCMP2298]
MLTGFRALMEDYCSPANYQIFLFCRESQPRYPYPSFKTARVEREDEVGERRRTPPTTAAAPRKDPSRKEAKTTPTSKPSSPSSPSTTPTTCFMSVLREYKIPLKGTQEIPRLCDDSCKRVHFAQLPKATSRAPLLRAAATIKILTDTDRESLIAKITADKRLK